MVKKGKTWKQFTASQPARRVIHKEGDLDISTPLKALSWDKKYRMRHQMSRDYVIICKDDIFFMGLSETGMSRVGNRIFRSSFWCGYVRIDSRQAKGKNLKYYAYDFLKILGIDWFRDLSAPEINFIARPVIFKKIITGDIYSQETLWKNIISTCFRLSRLPWRTVRDYFRASCYCFSSPSLHDIVAFTKNPSISMEKLTNAIDGDKTMYDMMSDLIQNAVRLNQVVDLSWSPRRMSEEHRRQIDRIMELDSSSLSVDEIQKSRVEEENIRMLNTEKEIYMEGRMMSHCIFTNYSRDIKDMKLLAFHMSSPEDCTFSVNLNYDGMPAIQQIYLAHNKNVQSSTRDVARDFVRRNSEAMFAMLSHRASSRSQRCEDDDLPF